MHRFKFLGHGTTEFPNHQLQVLVCHAFPLPSFPGSQCTGGPLSPSPRNRRGPMDDPSSRGPDVSEGHRGPDERRALDRRADERALEPSLGPDRPSDASSGPIGRVDQLEGPQGRCTIRAPSSGWPRPSSRRPIRARPGAMPAMTDSVGIRLVRTSSRFAALGRKSTNCRISHELRQGAEIGGCPERGTFGWPKPKSQSSLGFNRLGWQKIRSNLPYRG